MATEDLENIILLFIGILPRHISFKIYLQQVFHFFAIAEASCYHGFRANGILNRNRIKSIGLKMHHVPCRHEEKLSDTNNHLAALGLNDNI